MIDRLNSSLVQGLIKDSALAAELIRLSWKENHTRSFDFTPEFIQSLLEYPGDGPVLAPAYYDDGKLVAFVMGFPRSMRINGEVRRLLLMTFFTVAPGYKGRGLGQTVWAECLKEARKAGYDGALHYCLDGEPSNSITVRSASSAGFEARRVFTVKFMMRALHAGAEQPHEGTPASVDVFLSAVASMHGEVPVQRTWSVAEARWALHRPRAVCSTNLNGGMLTGYIIHGSDMARTPYFWVEDILWGRLSPKQRTGLLNEVLQRAAVTASLAVVPILKYSDLSPFTAVGFRLFPRLLHTYLTLWTGRWDGAELPCLYADVL
jgi:GNAT superfamily N-acetyltransferase